jgi:PHD/YefM family antitoxin component YafN of YafNO toxin-antitoxin module
MSIITANELKTKGVTALEQVFQHDTEAIISVRGENKYVVIDFEQYNKFREYELEIALLEARADIANGKVVSESVDEHMKRVVDGL